MRGYGRMDWTLRAPVMEDSKTWRIDAYHPWEGNVVIGYIETGEADARLAASAPRALAVMKRIRDSARVLPPMRSRVFGEADYRELCRVIDAMEGNDEDS